MGQKDRATQVIYDHQTSSQVRRMFDQIRLWTALRGQLLPFISWDIPPMAQA